MTVVNKVLVVDKISRIILGNQATQKGQRNQLNKILLKLTLNPLT